MSHTKTIVFIHGMFQNPKSWTGWKKYFQERGYACHTPAYPYHEGDPEFLRKNINPGLRTLTFGQVIESLGAFIDTLPEKPILIGHSMGGLSVQKLISLNKGVAGICLDTAAPSGIMSFEWSFLRANLPTINPLKGNSPCLPSVEWFHYAFCNTMSMEETKIAYDLYVVPEGRNVPRSSTGKDGTIDFTQPHAPLLFVAGEKDHIIPSSLNKKNFDAYTNSASRKDFKEFPGRTHFIPGQTGWEEVAGFCENWIAEVLPK